ncbi:uncharacterized protein LOC111712628 [Eurytemora carolleeae]|uniref:uncharacterized protein LOC111712628 n=1 Tax=Eurytemora carolleeae TaxID=1294199 RepID=UPI000C7747B1|nr:uncharacterized protein LOC111712628 [Eurytemora carolleeae]|eukprot:XP_023343073.1 uncharacterized protein LOC111712628 [Eurytemora affinis]
MESYNNYDYGNGGLFFSNMSTGLGLGGIGNLDRLTPGPKHYDIFNSFNLPKVTNDDIFLSDDEENCPKPRLPLFSRCPLTNRAQLEPPTSTYGGKMKSMPLSPLKNLTIGTSPIKNRGSPFKSRNYDILGHSPRIPLLNLANQANR